jgi:hypothetical protein
VESKLPPKQEDVEEGNGLLLGNVDELDVNKENDPPSKRYTIVFRLSSITFLYSPFDLWISLAYYV